MFDHRTSSPGARWRSLADIALAAAAGIAIGAAVFFLGLAFVGWLAWEAAKLAHGTVG